jgi:hypothetical protein
MTIDIIGIFDDAAKLLPFMDSPKARVLSAAIGHQESRFIHRRQINGPARGFWQFERASPCARRGGLLRSCGPRNGSPSGG